jgi:hypothetical protein
VFDLIDFSALQEKAAGCAKPYLAWLCGRCAKFMHIFIHRIWEQASKRPAKAPMAHGAALLCTHFIAQAFVEHIGCQ